jgi:galactose-6-phosphate isomerase
MTRPRLDVTSVLKDSLFRDHFDVTRNVQTVGNDGNVIDTPTAFLRISGVVNAMNSAILVRNDVGEMLAGDIQIFTKFKLTDGTGTLDADIVTWDGQQYTIVNIDNWSRFGKGYVRAIAKVLKLNA